MSPVDGNSADTTGGAAGDRLVEQDLLVRLGAAMTFAGEAIDEVGRRLLRIGEARGAVGLSVIVLPTALLVQMGRHETTRVQFESYPNRTVRLDQVSRIYAIADKAEDPAFPAEQGVRELQEILVARPRWGVATRVVGLGVLSVGYSLLLQPSVTGMVIAFVLGMGVGLFRLVDPPGLASVMPYLSTFLVAAAVFATADTFSNDNPVRTLIPPLVTFVPGALMTTGMRDLAAGQTISGASRLVQAIVVLLMLAFSISAAATLVGAPRSDLLDIPSPQLGPWAPWLGIFVVAAGTLFHHCAPIRAVPWIVAVMLVAYGGQALGARVFSAELSAFFGALAMTPVVLWFERFRGSPPSLVTFLPGFWLLVPGAAGLIGVTAIVGTDSSLGAADFVETMITVVQISFGVLIGAALFHTGRAGVHEAAKAIPSTDELRRWGNRWSPLGQRRSDD